MPSTFPYFKWFPADAETDNFYASLSDEEVGVYHRLLNRSWINDGIPADLETLRALVHRTPASFKKLWEKLSSRWIESPRDKNRLVNPRQESEWQKAIEISENNKRPGNTNANRTRIERESNGTRIEREKTPRASESDCVLNSLLSKKKEPEDKNSLFQEEEIAETSETSPSDVRSDVPSPDWFSQWWAIYWLKNAKKDARKAFAHHVKTEARFQRVMAATREQSPEMMSREPSKRPYGATWLNGERWEDEPAAVPVNGSQTPGARPSSTDAVRALALRNLERTGQLL